MKQVSAGIDDRPVDGVLSITLGREVDEVRSDIGRPTIDPGDMDLDSVGIRANLERTVGDSVTDEISLDGALTAIVTEFDDEGMDNY